jgi:VWFA-related protein
MLRSLSTGNLTGIVLAVFLAGPVWAQDQHPAQPQAQPGNAEAPRQDYVIHETTHRVLVDVVVRDAHGDPVRGLKQSDFTIQEDGKPQQILSFDKQDGNSASYVPPKLPPMPPNTFLDLPKEEERGPLYVLLYDMVNTETQDQMTTRTQLLNFIDNKPAGTRFAIFVNADGFHMVQGFTSDRALLRAAVTSDGPGPHIPKVFLYGLNYGKYSTSAMVSIFNFLAEYLEGMPGRKNLLWLSGSFPMQLNADPNHERDLGSDDVREAVAAMMRSQIAIYPVDVRGVSGAGGFEGMASTGASSGAPSIAGGSAELATKAYNSVTAGSGGEYLQMKEIAKMTGGEAYTGDNDLRALMGEAVDHGENYYTISYRSTNEKYDGLERHIDVKVDGKGYKLAYRQFYFALPEENEVAGKKPNTPDARFVAAKENDTLATNVEHGAPMLHDLIFRAQLQADQPNLATPEQMAALEDEPAYFRTRKKDRQLKPLPPVKLQKYLIDYTVIDAQLKAIAERTGRPATIEFAAVAYDANGRMLNGIVNNALAQPPSQTGPSAGPNARPLFRVQQELYVPAGAAWIRMAVRDTLTNRTGTLEVPLPLASQPPTTANAGQ